jgi:hypothetical protein
VIGALIDEAKGPPSAGLFLSGEQAFRRIAPEGRRKRRPSAFTAMQL